MDNKKIIFQVTLEYMKRNKKRTLITFAGIVVMVILMTAVFVGRDTALEFLSNAVAAEKGSWHAQVYQLNKEQVEEVEKLPYVGRLEVSRPLGYIEFPQSAKKNETPYLEVKGYTRGMFDLLSISLKEGRFPENENELVLSERAIRDGADIHLGDTIEGDFFERYIHAFAKGTSDGEAAIGRGTSDGEAVIDREAPDGFLMFTSGFQVQHGETKVMPDHFPYFGENQDFEEIHKATGRRGSYTVVGIMESPYYETDGMGGYIALSGTEKTVMPAETVNIVLQIDLRRRISYLDVELNRIVNLSRTEEEMEELQKNGTACIGEKGERIPVEQGRVVINETLLEFSSRGMDGTFYEISIFFQAFFILLIILASMVLIVNMFSISYHERCRYLGMLSSVGATRAQKRASVYAEVGILLAAALPIGILSGLLVVKGGMMFLYPHFISIISLIADNVFSGRGSEVDYHVIVKTANLIMVILFSALAVGISAWIPARRVGKIGPIESIRGNDDVRVKKGRTLLFLMKKGRAERLLAFAGTTRNTHCTAGIVRSISAFLILTVVTAFSAHVLTEIISQRANNVDFEPGDAFQGYEYVFGEYNPGEFEEAFQDIYQSGEVSGRKELTYQMFGIDLCMDETSEEYRESLRQILLRYFPEGIPADVEKTYLYPDPTDFQIFVNRLVVTKEEFEEIRKRAQLPEVQRQEGGLNLLVYDTVALSTEEYRYAFSGAVKADYARYEVKYPLKCKVGEQFTMMDYNYETQEPIYYSGTLAGYVGADDVKDLIKIHDGSLWVILSQEDDDMMAEKISEWRRGIYGRELFFNMKEGENGLLRRLGNYKDEWGESALSSAGMLTQYNSFTGAIIQIIDILAMCFTLFVALISLLNLYNSVMGRRLARQKELAILASMGITKGQLVKMLCLENLYLFLKSFVYGALITAGFVVSLHMVVSARFGRLLFHMPTWMIVVPILVSAIALTVFTGMCYRKNGRGSILEEIRAESV